MSYSITQWLTIDAHNLTGCAGIHNLTSLAANYIIPLDFYEVRMKPLASSTITSEKSTTNDLTVLVEF